MLRPVVVPITVIGWKMTRETSGLNSTTVTSAFGWVWNQPDIWVSEHSWLQPQVIIQGEGGRYYHTLGGFKHPVSYVGNIACQIGLAYTQKLAFNQALFIKPSVLFRLTSDEPVSYYGAPVLFQLSAGYLIAF